MAYCEPDFSFEGKSMSNSKKKHPIVARTCAESEKKDKRSANRALRRTVNSSLRNADFENYVVPLIREVSNVWSFAKDGKIYVGADTCPRVLKDLRK
jgi:hypothetical protein